MPLQRTNVTAASRIMLPTYAAMHTIIGLLFIFQDPRRTAGSAFEVARELLPMPGWGVIFLGIAAMEWFALARHKRAVYMAALTWAAGVVAFWTVLVLAATITNHDVSFTSCVWVGGWVAAHMATVRSLAVRERS